MRCNLPRESATDTIRAGGAGRLNVTVAGAVRHALRPDRSQGCRLVYAAWCMATQRPRKSIKNNSNPESTVRSYGMRLGMSAARGIAPFSEFS